MCSLLPVPPAASASFVTVPKDLIDDTRISKNGLIAYIALKYTAETATSTHTRCCLEQLKELGRFSKSTAYSALKELKHHGYIGHRKTGNGDEGCYLFLDPLTGRPYMTKEFETSTEQREIRAAVKITACRSTERNFVEEQEAGFPACRKTLFTPAALSRKNEPEDVSKMSRFPACRKTEYTSLQPVDNFQIQSITGLFGNSKEEKGHKDRSLPQHTSVTSTGFPTGRKTLRTNGDRFLSETGIKMSHFPAGWKTEKTVVCSVENLQIEFTSNSKALVYKEWEQKRGHFQRNEFIKNECFPTCRNGNEFFSQSSYIYKYINKLDTLILIKNCSLNKNLNFSYKNLFFIKTPGYKRKTLQINKLVSECENGKISQTQPSQKIERAERSQSIFPGKDGGAEQMNRILTPQIVDAQIIDEPCTPATQSLPVIPVDTSPVPSRRSSVPAEPVDGGDYAAEFDELWQIYPQRSTASSDYYYRQGLEAYCRGRREGISREAYYLAVLGYRLDVEQTRRGKPDFSKIYGAGRFFSSPALRDNQAYRELAIERLKGGAVPEWFDERHLGPAVLQTLGKVRFMTERHLWGLWFAYCREEELNPQCYFPRDKTEELRKHLIALEEKIPCKFGEIMNRYFRAAAQTVKEELKKHA